jgi:hypothetical protein
LHWSSTSLEYLAGLMQLVLLCPTIILSSRRPPQSALSRGTHLLVDAESKIGVIGTLAYTALEAVGPRAVSRVWDIRIRKRCRAQVVLGAWTRRGARCEGCAGYTQDTDETDEGSSYLHPSILASRQGWGQVKKTNNLNKSMLQ